MNKIKVVKPYVGFKGYWDRKKFTDANGESFPEFTGFTVVGSYFFSSRAQSLKLIPLQIDEFLYQPEGVERKEFKLKCNYDLFDFTVVYSGEKIAVFKNDNLGEFAACLDDRSFNINETVKVKFDYIFENGSAIHPRIIFPDGSYL